MALTPEQEAWMQRVTGMGPDGKPVAPEVRKASDVPSAGGDGVGRQGSASPSGDGEADGAATNGDPVPDGLPKADPPRSGDPPPTDASNGADPLLIPVQQSGGSRPPRAAGGPPRTTEELFRLERWAGAERELRRLEPDNPHASSLSAPGSVPNEAAVSRLEWELGQARARATGRPNSEPTAAPAEAPGPATPSFSPLPPELQPHQPARPPPVPGDPWHGLLPSAPLPVQPTPRTGVLGGTPVGAPEPIDLHSHRDKQDGLRFQTASEDAMAAAGYHVERNPVVRPEERLTPEQEGLLGPKGLDPLGRIGSDKNPDDRIGGHLTDMVAPKSANPEQVRKALSDKVKKRQAYRLVLHLGRTSVTREQVEELLQRKPVEGLQELFIIEQNGAVWRTFPDPGQITPGR